MTYKSLLAAATIGLALTQHAYGAQSVSSIADVHSGREIKKTSFVQVIISTTCFSHEMRF